jgi:PAS domain S-box-containing protein
MAKVASTTSAPRLRRGAKERPRQTSPGPRQPPRRARPRQPPESPAVPVADPASQAETVVPALQRRNDYLTALQQTTLDLVSELDLDTLLENIVRRVSQFLGTSSGCLVLLDPETNQFKTRVATGALVEVLKYPVQPGVGFGGTVWQTGRPLLVDDYDTWPGRIQGFGRHILGSNIAVPLQSGSRQIGMLGLAHEAGSPRKFGPEAVEALSEFARLAVIAIDNARLFAAAQQELDRRRQAEQELSRDVAERRTAEAALRDSEQRLRILTETNPVGIATATPDGRFLTVNPAMWRMFGYRSQEDFLQVPIEAWYVNPEDRNRYLALVREGLAADFEAQFRRRDESHFWGSITAKVVTTEAGQTHLIGTFQDVTQRVEAEQARREAEAALRQAHAGLERRVDERTRSLAEANTRLGASETHYRILANNTTHWEFWESPEFQFIYVSPACERITGRPPEEFMADPQLVDKIVHPDDLPAYLRHRREGLEVLGWGTVEFRVRHRDGTWRWVEHVCRPVYDEAGALLGWRGSNRDITGRKQMEAELQASEGRYRERAEELQTLTDALQAANAQLHQLSRRTVAVQEEERRRIGRELHDEVGQALTGILLLLDTHPGLAPEAAKTIGEVRTLAAELADRVHDISLDLRPSLLDDLGLLPTLIWHFQRYRAQTRVRVNFEHTGLDRRFPPEVETAAYRIVQEALTNVARHARVDEATVRVWTAGDWLYVKIQDHGVGFVDSPALDAATGGLSSMRERAGLLGGEFSLAAAPGLGVTVWAAMLL